ncbi:MAG TPA: GNAT family N-acetyltransferase [Acidimicrobiia bacterium]|nr:GNAT family N-acetyltransferase [Acidimicrobiia bacterium]
MFSPLRTERLLIRPFRPDDLEPFLARRNDPDVARYQNWTLPFPRTKAEQIVSELVAMEGPQIDEWWMAAIADPDTDEPIGDLALHLTWEGHTAEVGYTLAHSQWGKGYATEALNALVDYLFQELDITRAFGMLHPANRASAMVLERCGFLFEGHTRSSFWLDGEVSDDHIYGMLRPDWEAWRTRPRRPPDQLRLLPITADNQRRVFNLRTHKTQEAFVATMAQSFADALFPETVNDAPVVPWMRAIEADGDIVGFVMVAVATEHHPEPYLWRLLIDRLHQRRGIATGALDLLEEELRGMGDRTLVVSWEEGKGSPRPFYLARGFEPTGNVVDGETEARKRLV